MKLLLAVLFLPFIANAQSAAEISRWQHHAKNVTVYRDHYGVPHVYGKTDGDAVFGLMYAQCEDDFPRIEMNYVEKMGRMAELKGEEALYEDLYVRLVIDSDEAKADYNKAPLWLKKLMQAWADGINFFLHEHPQIQPVLIKKFEPWMTLLWTDGSIGAISTGNVTEKDVESFYGERKTARQNSVLKEEQFAGSNGFAISPSRSASGNALLYINPHVTFYFRPEVHMASKEGLNVYGAVTWGQFFIYQGFNEYCGWMHTSSDVDVADNYIEKIKEEGGTKYYLYNGQWKKAASKTISIKIAGSEQAATKEFTVYRTGHGPIMAKLDSEYISVRSSNRMMKGLMQSWMRTKAKGLEDYKRIMELRGNTSNNTVFADNKGNIAYWHGNYIPIRDKNYNWGSPVDGTIFKTNWQGIHQVKDIVQVINPATGWIQNCNSTPYTVSGAASPVKKNYPPYMAPDGENFRGVNAVRVLQDCSDMGIDKLIVAGYDKRLTAFEVLVPVLIKAFDEQQDAEVINRLKAPVDTLRNWNFEAAENSVATSLAVHWGEQLPAVVRKVYIDEGEPDQVAATKMFADSASSVQLLRTFDQAIAFIQSKNNGEWNIAWGKINRYQRISRDIDNKFDDNKISYPVAFAASTWGQLPSYSSRYFAGVGKRYGVGGNSFICAVEFGKKVKAKSLLAGGNSGNPTSPHFTDQLVPYTQGHFKEVLFYKEDVIKAAEKIYRPGEENKN